MPSLMVPTVAAPQGITNRVNGFESDFSDIRQAQTQSSREAAAQQQLLANAITMATEAHNAANEAMVLDYANRLEREHQQIMTGLRTKSNKDAVDAYQSTLGQMQAAVDRYSEELKDADPSVKTAFMQVAQRVSLRSISNVDAYVIQESKRYRTNELKARVEIAAEDVMRNFDNPALRNSAIARWKAARQAQDADLGIEWGSAQSISSNLESMSPVYASKADMLSNMENYAGALEIIQEGIAGGYLKGDAANKAIARTYARQEVTKRQRLADARAAQSHAQSMALAQEKMRTEELKQAKYVREQVENAAKIANSPMSPYLKSAAIDTTAAQLLKSKDYLPGAPQELRQMQALADATVAVEQESARRDKSALANNQALQTAQLLAGLGTGHGDNAWESALWAAQAINNDALPLPDGYTKELINSQLAVLQNSPNFTPESVTAALNLRFGRAPSRATDLAVGYVAMLNPTELPRTAQGEVDLLQLNTFLSEQGLSNYDITKVANLAQQKVATIKDTDAALLNETFVHDDLMAMISKMATEELDTTFDDTDFADAVDFSLESGGDPLLKNAGGAIMELVFSDAQQAALEERRRNPNLTGPQMLNYMRNWVRGAKGKESFGKHLRTSMQGRGILINELESELSLGAAQLEEARR